MRTIYKFLILSVAIYVSYKDIISITKFSYKCRDPRISQKYNGDTIPVRSFLWHSFLGPLVMLALIELFKHKSLNQMSGKAIFSHYKKCVVGEIFILGITEVVKCITKHPRPHFLDSCRPDSNYICKEGDAITEFTCTNSNMVVDYHNDLIKSFPSGHTAVSVFLALYCCNTIRTNLPQRSIAKIILFSACVIWSLVLSASRITDGRHHWWDVLAGAVLGVISVFYVVHQGRKKALDNVLVDKKIENY